MTNIGILLFALGRHRNTNAKKVCNAMANDLSHIYNSEHISGKWQRGSSRQSCTNISSLLQYA